MSLYQSPPGIPGDSPLLPSRVTNANTSLFPQCFNLELNCNPKLWTVNLPGHSAGCSTPSSICFPGEASSPVYCGVCAFRRWHRMKSPLQLCSFSVTHRPVTGCGRAGKFSGEKRVPAWQCGQVNELSPSSRPLRGADFAFLMLRVNDNVGGCSKNLPVKHFKWGHVIS